MIAKELHLSAETPVAFIDFVQNDIILDTTSYCIMLKSVWHLLSHNWGFISLCMSINRHRLYEVPSNAVDNHIYEYWNTALLMSTRLSINYHKLHSHRLTPLIEMQSRCSTLRSQRDSDCVLTSHEQIYRFVDRSRSTRCYSILYRCSKSCFVQVGAIETERHSEVNWLLESWRPSH